jgi:hypothetical protein
MPGLNLGLSRWQILFVRALGLIVSTATLLELPPINGAAHWCSIGLLVRAAALASPFSSGAPRWHPRIPAPRWSGCFLPDSHSAVRPNHGGAGLRLPVGIDRCGRRGVIHAFAGLWTRDPKARLLASARKPLFMAGVAAGGLAGSYAALWEIAGYSAPAALVRGMSYAHFVALQMPRRVTTSVFCSTCLTSPWVWE